MTRSTKHSLEYCNKGKREALKAFRSRYLEMLDKFVNIVWHKFRHSWMSMLPSDVCNQISTGVEFDSRIRQAAAKQALAMVKAVDSKQDKRLWKLAQLQREGKKDIIYLQRKIALAKQSKPNTKNVNPVLDARFADFEETPNGHFDLFLRLSSLGNKQDIKIPLDEHKVDKKWKDAGGIRNGSVTLCEDYVGLSYEVPTPPKRTEGKVVGADQGLLTCLSISNGNLKSEIEQGKEHSLEGSQVTTKDRDGWDLDGICERLARRIYGSKGFLRTQEHRQNYINWSVEQIDFSEVKKVNLERIRNIRKGRNQGRKMSRWTYGAIKTKLERRGEAEGFSVAEQNNKFRSQRCSQCGWTHESNRKGKTFRCQRCGFHADADLNAASNHETELCDIQYGRAWTEHLNRTSGFYWMGDGIYARDGTPIVSHVA